MTLSARRHSILDFKLFYLKKYDCIGVAWNMSLNMNGYVFINNIKHFVKIFNSFRLFK